MLSDLFHPAVAISNHQSLHEFSETNDTRSIQQQSASLLVAFADYKLKSEVAFRVFIVMVIPYIVQLSFSSFVDGPASLHLSVRRNYHHLLRIWEGDFRLFNLPSLIHHHVRFRLCRGRRRRRKTDT